MDMKIMNVREGSGSALKYFDVQFGPVTTCGWKYMDGQKGTWIAPPQRPYEKDGETKYADIVQITKAFSRYLLALLDEKFVDQTFQQESSPPVRSRQRQSSPQAEYREYRDQYEKDEAAGGDKIPF